MSDACRILLVEDDPADLELTLSALSRYGLAERTVAVNSGDAALDYLYRRGRWRAGRSVEPAIVLLDLKMPKVSGFDVLAAIRSEPHLHGLPVVIFTSSAEKSDVRACYRAGASGYVVKPGDLEKFVTAVQNIVRFWLQTNVPPPLSTGLPRRLSRARADEAALPVK